MATFLTATLTLRDRNTYKSVDIFMGSNRLFCVFVQFNMSICMCSLYGSTQIEYKINNVQLHEGESRNSTDIFRKMSSRVVLWKSFHFFPMRVISNETFI